ncbi:MAG: DNA translocase FtsK 4TM domain-containing protein, partial [Acidobacteriota bacterium]|nr:DNA translocase FtsK 4TM domain-containing protein [Acidobacteriota bacterium]
MAVELKNKIAPKIYSRSGEIIAVGLAAAAVLVFLCLVSYSANDWSLNSTGLGKTQNWIGIVGSVTADLMFQAVGLTAYFFPLLLGLAAWRFFRVEEIAVSVGRVVGYVFFVASAASLFVVLGTSGGIIGAFFANGLMWLLSKIGAGILLAAILATAILLITNLSFAAVFGDFVLAWENFRVHCGEWLGGFQKWRTARNTAAAQARLEKNREMSKNKLPRKTPTISTGDAFAIAKENSKKSSANEKTASVGEKLSAIFKKIKDSGKRSETENVEKTVSETAAVEESAPPVIAVSEGTTAADETDSFAPVFAPRRDEPVTFTPVQPTGELDAEILHETESVNTPTADLPELPRQPQNFDNYVLPKAEFLNPPPPRVQIKEDEARAQAKELEEKTKEFNATGRVVNICPGPVVTTYEFKPDPGVKYSRITGLADDLCLALEAESIRIDRIPGKAFVGIEVPNTERDTIHLREVIE